MKRSYRLERWITAILFSIFIIPFVAEAENFYAAIAGQSPPGVAASAPRVLPLLPLNQHPDAPPANCPLPEDALENAIDRDPTEAELDGECC